MTTIHAVDLPVTNSSPSGVHTMRASSSKKVATMFRSLVRWAGVLVVVGATVGLTSCVADVEPAVAVPADYYAYPYTYYDRHIVYHVNGSWYYPYANRWYQYRRVPPDLARRNDSHHYQ